VTPAEAYLTGVGLAVVAFALGVGVVAYLKGRGK